MLENIQRNDKIIRTDVTYDVVTIAKEDIIGPTLICLNFANDIPNYNLFPFLTTKVSIFNFSDSESYHNYGGASNDTRSCKREAFGLAEAERSNSTAQKCDSLS